MCIYFIYLCSVPISCFPDLILKIKLFYKYDFCWICNGDQITTFSFILFQQSSWYQNNAVEVKGFHRKFSHHPLIHWWQSSCCLAWAPHVSFNHFLNLCSSFLKTKYCPRTTYAYKIKHFFYNLAVGIFTYAFLIIYWSLCIRVYIVC